MANICGSSRHFFFLSLHMHSFPLLPFDHTAFECVSRFASTNLLFFWSRLLKEQKVSLSSKSVVYCISDQVLIRYSLMCYCQKSHFFRLCVRARPCVRACFKSYCASLLNQGFVSSYIFMLHYLFSPPPPLLT